MEYRNDNYKLLFTLPVRRIDLYLAKILYLIKIIFLSTLIAYFSYVGSGYLFELMIPAYSFQDYNVDSAIFMFFCKLFISLSAIALIQHSISLLFRQFVIPVGFGCFATLAGLIIMRVSWNDFIPYISVYKSYEGFFHEIDNPEKYDYINIGYCLIFLFIGYILFERNKGKSNL
jgi:hypothetical protein